MKKNNALLVWKGRKLMCNGVCVGGVGKQIYGGWGFSSGCVADLGLVNGTRKTEVAARRAVNRRFGLKD